MAESVFDRDLNLSNFRIKNLGAAVDPNDAVSKSYLELNKARLFDNIESFALTSNTITIQLSNPTDVYSCLVFHNGLLMSPSAIGNDGNMVVRDYEIITYATYSEIDYLNAVTNGTNILVLYNTVSNQ